jgi:CRP/FNR family transcriptional regulator
MSKTKFGAVRPAPKSLLSAIEAFKNASALALSEIERVKIEKRFGKHDSIFLEDDAADYVWFVKEGHVKEVIHSADGKNLTLSMVGTGGVFGTSAFTGGEYGCHGVAETEATVLAFPVQAFQVLMGKYPEIARAVVAQISKLLRRSKDTQTFAQESVEKRLLHVLIEMAGEFGTTVPLTRKEIAEMAGTTVETCIRTFAHLEEAGLIATERGKFTIRSVQDLINRMEKD